MKLLATVAITVLVTVALNHIAARSPAARAILWGPV